jgi:hypothetical protein
MQFISNIVNYFKANLILCFVMYAIGNVVGGGLAYQSIAKDCQVMGSYRVGDHSYNCTKVLKVLPKA